MISKAQKVRLAVFFIIGFTVLATILVMLLGSKITERRDNYSISYEDTSVAGLQIGGAVLFRGIRIGRIDDIQIDRENINAIIVYISVKHGTPIKADQIATLVGIGITGLKQIELSGGTNEAPFLQPGGRIQAGRGLFESIGDRAEVLTLKVETIIDNIIEITNPHNQIKIESILSSIEVMLSESQQPVVKTMSNISEISQQLSVAMVSAQEIIENINEAFGEERLVNIVKSTEKMMTDIAEIDLTQINTTFERLNESIARTNVTIGRVESLLHRSSPDISASLVELRETLESLNEFSRLIAEDPSILIRSRR
jgi:phospholipid/cholesterol/gamma-HCH transport system substrate-binding protein